MKIWENRIIEHGTAPASSYQSHELNARRHPTGQREALTASLNEVGWVSPVIVSARTGKILDGHARVEEALKKGDETEVPFIKVDVSDREEAIILASYDPITNLATYDTEALDRLLSEVSTGEEGLLNLLATLAEEQQVVDLSESPEEFTTVDDDLETSYKCPKCQYEWSGKPK